MGTDIIYTDFKKAFSDTRTFDILNMGTDIIYTDFKKAFSDTRTFDIPDMGTDIIYTDFKKAFDSVPHRRLLPLCRIKITVTAVTVIKTWRLPVQFEWQLVVFSEYTCQPYP